MKPIQFLFAGLLILLMSCEEKKKTSAEFNDTYYGILPCPECPAIYYELTLNEDLTYTERSFALDSDEDTIVVEGNFEFGNDSVLTLKNRSQTGDSRRFKFSKGEFTLLRTEENDNSGSPVPFVLRITEPVTEDFYKMIASSASTGLNVVAPELEGNWILEKLNDGIVKNTSSYKTPTIEIEPSEGKLLGNSGCNKYWGVIEQPEGNEVDIFLLKKTNLPCPEADLEEEYLEALTGEVLKFEITNEKLMLFNDEATLVFEKANNSKI